MLLISLLLLGQETTVSAAVADYRSLTRAEIPCRSPADSGEIVVCARREADRYRVPLVTVDLHRDSDAARLERLIGEPEQQGITPCGEGAFTVKCGKVGISATVGADGRVRTSLRELAP